MSSEVTPADQVNPVIVREKEEEALRQDLWDEFLPDRSEHVETLVWNLAWDYGHSGGYEEIRYYYQDLAELVSSIGSQ